MFNYVCKLSLVTAKMFEVRGFYFGLTGYNMPVVKVLVVQIQLDTILSYLKQVWHKRVLAFFRPFLALISILGCKLLFIYQIHSICE